jgi:hypothetical protein
VELRSLPLLSRAKSQEQRAVFNIAVNPFRNAYILGEDTPDTPLPVCATAHHSPVVIVSAPISTGFMPEECLTLSAASSEGRAFLADYRQNLPDATRYLPDIYL